MSDDIAYARWLRASGIACDPIDASQRSPIEVRLYLDDVRKCPFGYTLARSVAEAIAVMKAWNVTDASLDHDLGACSECIAADSHAAETLHCDHVPDGRAFVKWMIATGCWPRRKPTVHSANPSGAAAMRSMIDQHFEAP